MARQHPWYTPGQPASADDTWPLEDPYGEPGPGPAGTAGPAARRARSRQPGRRVRARRQLRMRRSPARPPAPRKARAGPEHAAAAGAGADSSGAGRHRRRRRDRRYRRPAGDPARARRQPGGHQPVHPHHRPGRHAVTRRKLRTADAEPFAVSWRRRSRPAISTAAARRVLASYWAANNQANKARSDTLLARIEAGTSYQMDAGAYRTGRAAGPGGSGYTPVTAQNPVLWIPRQPAGTYPRWFAARVTYTGEGAGYLVFTQPRAGAPWKNVLEPYLLPRHRARTVRHHRRQRVRGAGGPGRRWPGRHPRPDRGADRRLPRRRRGCRGKPGEPGRHARRGVLRRAPASPARQPGTGTRPAGWCSPCRLSAAGRSRSTA